LQAKKDEGGIIFLLQRESLSDNVVNMKASKPDRSVPVPVEVYTDLKKIAERTGTKIRFMVAEAIRAYTKAKREAA